MIFKHYEKVQLYKMNFRANKWSKIKPASKGSVFLLIFDPKIQYTFSRFLGDFQTLAPLFVLQPLLITFLNLSKGSLETNKVRVLESSN